MFPRKFEQAKFTSQLKSDVISSLWLKPNKNTEVNFDFQLYVYAATWHARFQDGRMEISTSQTERNYVLKAINEDASSLLHACCTLTVNEWKEKS